MNEESGLGPLKQAAIFALIALPLSWVPFILGRNEAGSPVPPSLTVIRATSPLLAALILRKVITRDGFADSGLTIRGIRPWLWIAALALPVAWHGLSLVAGLVLGATSVKAAPLSVGSMIAGLAGGLVWVLPEELGWRGTLVAKLRPLGIHPAMLITGVTWFAWHPELVLADQAWAITLLIFLDVILLSYAIGWIFLKTRSVWPCVLLHAAHNGLGKLDVADVSAPLLAELLFTGSLVIIVAALWAADDLSWSSYPA